MSRTDAVAVEAFQRHLLATHRAGLMNAVNMDTGYINYLNEPKSTMCCDGPRRRWAKTSPFVAGRLYRGPRRRNRPLYRQQMDLIVQFGGIPILFQTARLHGKQSKEKAAIYHCRVPRLSPSAGFRVGRHVRAQWRNFHERPRWRLMDIPEIKGMKHSSLDRLIELERLALRDALRPDFRIYTRKRSRHQHDRVRLGLPAGPRAFAPEKFAERDRLWEAGDPAYYALADALQYLGNVAFRPPFQPTNIRQRCFCI